MPSTSCRVLSVYRSLPWCLPHLAPYSVLGTITVALVFQNRLMFPRPLPARGGPVIEQPQDDHRMSSGVREEEEGLHVL